MTKKTDTLWAPRPDAPPTAPSADLPTLLPAPVAGPPSPMAMIQAAIEHKMDPAGLEKLTDLAERWRKMDAEQQFNEAMVACQADMPSVVKDAQAEKNTYAKYETIVRVAKPIYTRHGFAVTFVECVMIGETMMRVVGDVVHKGGHVKRHTFDLGLDGVGPKGQPLAMNRPQASGSTSSYGQRYLILRAFNIPVADEDDDAVQARTKTIGEKQIVRINDLWEQLEAAGWTREANFSAWMKWVNPPDMDLSRLTLERFRIVEKQLVDKLAKVKGVPK